MPLENREFACSDEDFRFLAGLVYERTGIVLGDHKRDMVYARLARRLRSLKMHNFAEYCGLLTSETQTDEMGQLVNAITTNLTSFFREPHHFEHLEKHLLIPWIKAQKNNNRLRIWSAGCASGEEVYSIAMVLAETLSAVELRDTRILATDIDTHMLATAEHGVYPAELAEKIPPRFHKYFTYAGGKIAMGDKLKSLIAFRRLNLVAQPWPMRRPFDGIFCRNVVIYFNKPTQKTLFDRMAELLVPAGWLYIGHSENLFNVSDRFQLIGKTVYRRVR